MIACWAPPPSLMPKQASLFRYGVPLDSPLEGHFALHSLWDLASITPAEPGVVLFISFHFVFWVGHLAWAPAGDRVQVQDTQQEIQEGITQPLLPPCLRVRKASLEGVCPDDVRELDVLEVPLACSPTTATDST